MTSPAATLARRALRLLWGLAADLAIFVFTVWWGLLCIIMILVTRKGWPADVFGRIWCRWIVAVCGIYLDVEGVENVDPRKSYVIISNHLSNFDIWVTMAALPLPIRFVAKKELLRFPIFGQALALSDHIIIDRARPEQAIERSTRKPPAVSTKASAYSSTPKAHAARTARCMPSKRAV